MITSELYEGFCTPPPSDCDDLEAWRAYRDQMQLLMEQLNECLREADEAELARVQEMAAKLQARLGTPVQPNPAAKIPTISAAKPHNPVSETDWGQGISGGREKPQDPGDFRAELADLRDRTTEKRARRGMP